MLCFHQELRNKKQPVRTLLQLEHLVEQEQEKLKEKQKEVIKIQDGSSSVQKPPAGGLVIIDPRCEQLHAETENDEVQSSFLAATFATKLIGDALVWRSSDSVFRQGFCGP